MDKNSPLRFLDIDVSRYLYETYYPSKKTKENYKRVMNELKKLRESYKHIDHYVKDEYGFEYRTCRIHRHIFTSRLFLQYIKEKGL